MQTKKKLGTSFEAGWSSRARANWRWRVFSEGSKPILDALSCFLKLPEAPKSSQELEKSTFFVFKGPRKFLVAPKSIADQF